MSRRRGACLVACVLAGLWTAGCGAGLEAPEHVLLITLDTTRADRLGCYGYESAATPRLDALAAEGALFLQAQAQVPVTLPSHATLFTGRYPPSHGVRYNGMFHLAESESTLAERLAESGWTTVGVPAAYPLTIGTGIGQGFGTYRDMFELAPREELPVNAERSAEEVADLGIEHLERDTDGSTFLWLHFFDPHYPYEPPFPYRSRFRDAPYDGEIAYVDVQVGRVLDALEATGRADRTLVIVAGDHGEGLYEHNEKMHSNLAYQSTLRVPLIVRTPGGEPTVVEEPVSLADVTPTVLDLLGLPLDGMQGRSLRPALAGGTLERDAIYVEAIAGSLVYGWSPIEGIRRGRYKYLRSSVPELYDLERDPDELENLHAQQPQRASDLAAELDALLESWGTADADAAATALPMDPQALARLASLGYVGGAVSESRKGGPHPADKVHLEVDVLVAREKMMERDWSGAALVWERILEADPTNRHGLLQAATTRRAMGETDRAEAHLRTALDVYPEFAPARYSLGELLSSTGRTDEAVEVLAAGFEHESDAPSPALRYRHAVALIAAGRFAEAQAAVSAALEEITDYPTFYVLDALCAAERADWTRASGAFETAFELGYRDRELLEHEPMLAPLRRHPEFASWLERLRDAGADADPAAATIAGGA